MFGLEKLFKKKKLKPKPRKSKSTSSIKETEPSSITFTFDKDLKVVVHTKINPEIYPSLISEKTIQETDDPMELAEATKYALVILANEASEQIIDIINKNSEDNSDE